jgi:hypothetical protein
MSAPTDRDLLKEMREVDDNLAKGEIELADEVDMKLTKDKKISHSNAWSTHRETNESLKKSRVKTTPCYLARAPKYLSTR